LEAVVRVLEIDVLVEVEVVVWVEVVWV